MALVMGETVLEGRLFRTNAAPRKSSLRPVERGRGISQKRENEEREKWENHCHCTLVLRYWILFFIRAGFRGAHVVLVIVSLVTFTSTCGSLLVLSVKRPPTTP